MSVINSRHLLVCRGLASTMRALSSAQQPIVDEVNSDWSENEEILNVGDRYQIVNSCLPLNGDYQIDKRMYFCLNRNILQFNAIRFD